MKIITVHAAKTNLSKLIAQACAGEEIIIARGPTPVARLVRYEQHAPRRRFGALKGAVSVSPAFFEPLPNTELAGWE